MKQIFLLFSALLCTDTVFAQYSLQLAFPNLPSLSRVTEMTIAPDGSDRIFLTEQNGKIYFFHNTPAVSTEKIFLDLSGTVTQNGSETGLLGIAFHPNFKTNGYFYVNYTSSPGGQLTSFISRFKVNPSNSDTVFRTTEQILITLPQPYSNHNGGHLAFGADGYLYASFGDGGSGGDPQNRAQNLDSLFGKILRIDVDHEANGLHYAIPSDNPFASNSGTTRKEIYAYGLRNTWKFSFDRTSGRLWAGDVGQNVYEEVDTISKGGNYGWRIMEGFHCYPPGIFNCDSSGLIPPLWEYPHQDGDVSITGGYVYRGNSIPSLKGKYIYGDYGSGRVWALTYEGVSPATTKLLIDRATPALNLSTFGEDQNKEIYFISFPQAKLYRLSSSEPVDHTPPQFTNHIHGGVDTIVVSDKGQGDFGLKSISWKGINSTDTSKFSFVVTPTILPCNSDNIEHKIIISQKDPAIGGCIEFTFIDCGNLQSLDTVCFSKHLLNINPDTINFGMVEIGSMASTNFTITESPDDGNSFLIDSIVVLPQPGSSEFHLTPTLVTPFRAAGSVSAFIDYLPLNYGEDTALVVFHSANTIDSLHFLHLFGSSKYLGSTRTFADKEFNMKLLSNPINVKISVQIMINEQGNVNLSLYDELGKPAENLLNEQKQPGEYFIDFDGSKLLSGSYILRLESGGKVISRKIIKE
jgi:glucose/arabinose dehydrogenase